MADSSSVQISKKVTIVLEGESLEYFHWLMNIARERLEEAIRKNDRGGWKGMLPSQLQKANEIASKLTEDT